MIGVWPAGSATWSWTTYLGRGRAAWANAVSVSIQSLSPRTPSTRSMVSKLLPPLPFSIRETVEVETPARRATSRCVSFWSLRRVFTTPGTCWKSLPGHVMRTSMHAVTRRGKRKPLPVNDLCPAWRNLPAADRWIKVHSEPGGATFHSLHESRAFRSSLTRR